MSEEQKQSSSTEVLAFSNGVAADEFTLRFSKHSMDKKKQILKDYDDKEAKEIEAATKQREEILAFNKESAGLSSHAKELLEFCTPPVADLQIESRRSIVSGMHELVSMAKRKPESTNEMNQAFSKNAKNLKPGQTEEVAGKTAATPFKTFFEEYDAKYNKK